MTAQPTLFDFISRQNKKPKTGIDIGGDRQHLSSAEKTQNSPLLASKANTIMTDGEYRKKYWDMVQIDPRKLLKYYYQRGGKGFEIADLILHGYHNDRRRRKEKNIDELSLNDLNGNWYLLYRLALMWKDRRTGTNHDFKPDKVTEG